MKGLALLDVESVPGKSRSVGELKTKSSLLNLELSGFENHSGHSILGRDVKPFAKVISGKGNGDGKFDGAMEGNVFGTYMHGPLLARNPAFADLLLTRAAKRKFAQISDPLAMSYSKIALKY